MKAKDTKKPVKKSKKLNPVVIANLETNEVFLDLGILLKGTSLNPEKVGFYKLIEDTTYIVFYDVDKRVIRTKYNKQSSVDLSELE